MSSRSLTTSAWTTKTLKSNLLEYLHGHGNIIPGSNALTGAKLGDTLDIIAEAEDAYGSLTPIQ